MSGALSRAHRRRSLLVALLVARASCSALALLIGNDYVFFAGYVVLQYIVLATAWNILGGYSGYVNFGTAGVLRARRLHHRRAAQARREPRRS